MMEIKRSQQCGIDLTPDPDFGKLKLKMRKGSHLTNLNEHTKCERMK